MDAKSRQTGKKKRFAAMTLLFGVLSGLVYLWSPVDKAQALLNLPL